jgi:excisionase family DNA binding protein
MLTLKEVAKRLNLHYNTIYNYVRLGELKAIKFNKVYRIREQDLDKFIKARRLKIN